MNDSAPIPTVAQILEQHGRGSRDALIPILQRVQELYGYLSEQSIAEIGRELRLPASKVYGVATFYNQFRFVPKGKFHVMVCRGTACHVKGSLKLLDSVTRLLKVRPGQTTRDGLFSLEVVACMGACGLAPAVNINGEMFAKLTPGRLERIVAGCRAHAQEESHVHA